MSMQPTVSVGDKFETRSGVATITKYESRNSVTVLFDNGYSCTCRLGNLRKMNVRNPYYLKIHGVGVVGEGDYSRKDKRAYDVWTNMLLRCYDKEQQLRPKYQCYVGCTVSEDWWNFQTFAKDYVVMVRGNEDFQLDKDLLYPGNTIYSKDTCVALPQELNCLLTLREKHRGPYPIGVYFDKQAKKFKAQLSVNSSRISLGHFGTPEEAFFAYKIAKESFIKQQAEKWRDKIDPRAYNALMQYEVEITD